MICHPHTIRYRYKKWAGVSKVDIVGDLAEARQRSDGFQKAHRLRSEDTTRMQVLRGTQI